MTLELQCQKIRATICYFTLSKISCLQVKASHGSGVLSSSFIFWCKTINKISADFKCIVSYCRLCKNET